MHQTDRVAVVTTQLAHIDRRVLSEAWYSALHLAGEPPHTRAAGGMKPAAAHVAQRSSAAPGATVRNEREAGSQVRTRNEPSNRRPQPASVERERRSPKTALAKRIERGVRTQAPHSKIGSFAVRDEHARVHVVVRTVGATTRVVAVCEPQVRERLERALAQARFALAGQAIRTEGVR